LESLPVVAQVLIFVGAAAIVWIAGIALSHTTDVLSVRLGIGQAVGGVILLAIATNLPEIAITASAAVGRNLEIAVGNILGGIAIQTVVLAVLDAVGLPKGSRPLTYQAASLVLVLEGALVVAMLVLVVIGTQLSSSVIAFRVTPPVFLLAIGWVVGVWLLSRADKGLPWHAEGEAPDGQPEPRGHSMAKKDAGARQRGSSTTRVAGVFGIAAAATLAGGVLLEQSGNGIAGHLNMNGAVFGATFLAGATALPELSTGLTSVRMADFQLAVSDIFGGNAFLPVLFLLATALSGDAVLPAAHRTDIYLTSLGALLTAIYIWGLFARPRRRILRMGIDSLLVVITYVIGIVGLFAVARG
jgi:cation:H+ antiporter